MRGDLFLDSKLHSNATTTPQMREYIQSSPDKSLSKLAQELGISESTVYRWRKRTGVHDRSSCPHRLQTTLSSHEEVIVVELRKALQLTLDDLLGIVRRFVNSNCSRSGLDRCLRRHGVSNLRQLIPRAENGKSKTVKKYSPGNLHVNIIRYKRHSLLKGPLLYMFVGIDYDTRWVYIEILPDKEAKTAGRFIANLIENCPTRIQRIQINDGSDSTHCIHHTDQSELNKNQHLQYKNICDMTRADYAQQKRIT